MTGMTILFLLVLAFPLIMIYLLVAVIGAAFLGRNTPKPPKNFTADQKFWWYKGGWRECSSDEEIAYWTERAKLKHFFKSNKRFEAEYGYLLAPDEEYIPEEDDLIVQQEAQAEDYTAMQSSPTMEPAYINVPKKAQEYNQPPLQETIDGIEVIVDETSAARVGILIDNLGIDINAEDDGYITFLFDVIALKAGEYVDATVYCNLYAGVRKLLTEEHYVYSEEYYRESVSVYFQKANIVTKATKIEVFCKQA